MKKLQGTEKQVNWANELRDKIFTKLETSFGTAKQLKTCGFTQDELESTIEAIKNIEEATTFINMRYDPAYLIIERYKGINIDGDIEKVKNDERTMKRINKIKNLDKSESYIETTEVIISNLISKGNRESKAILEKLLKEV